MATAALDRRTFSRGNALNGEVGMAKTRACRAGGAGSHPAVSGKEVHVGRVTDATEATCWLCKRQLGSRVEYHHQVPKSRGGRETVAVHPICHRTLHKTFSNAELGMFGASVAAIKADPRIARFLAWIANKEPDFHAPTHKRR